MGMLTGLIGGALQGGADAGLDRYKTVKAQDFKREESAASDSRARALAQMREDSANARNDATIEARAEQQRTSDIAAAGRLQDELTAKEGAAGATPIAVVGENGAPEYVRTDAALGRTPYYEPKSPPRSYLDPAYKQDLDFIEQQIQSLLESPMRTEAMDEQLNQLQLQRVRLVTSYNNRPTPSSVLNNQ